MFDLIFVIKLGKQKHKICVVLVFLNEFLSNQLECRLLFSLDLQRINESENAHKGSAVV